MSVYVFEVFVCTYVCTGILSLLLVHTAPVEKFPFKLVESPSTHVSHYIDIVFHVTDVIVSFK